MGFRGTEGLEVDFEVTRAHVETSPLWRLLNWGIEFFQRKKHFRVVSCGFVDGGFEEFRISGNIITDFITTSLHHHITKKSTTAKVLLRF